MNYRDKYAETIARQFYELEDRIIIDIVRRIKKTDDFTSTADWQINKLVELGYSSADIEEAIKKATKATYPDMFELYDKTIEQEYTRNKKIYEQINGKFIPYNENEQLKQWTEAVKRQTEESLKNITRTMGIVETVNGQYTFIELTDFYRKTLDAAMLDITSGAFDYNSVLKKTVETLSNSGIRTIDYASGRSSRIAVAVRRAIMAGASQLAGQISEMNAEKLGTEYFEVSYHGGARPSHRKWQGRVYSKKELTTVCGLGKPDGLKGVNCYHDYYPFIPGVSKRRYSDKWLKEQEKLENKQKYFKGKKYNPYEAKQKQRQMETSMRAQRQKIKGLEIGGADKDDIITAKARYNGQLAEYKAFSDKMGLKAQMERVYIDGTGRTALTGKAFKKYQTDDIIKKELKAAKVPGKIHVNPTAIKTGNLSFDSKHVNKEREHDVSLVEAKRFIKNASFSTTVWNGRFERYYSHEGAVYVNRWENTIRTAYKKEEFDNKTKGYMEVIKKHGR